MGASRKEESVLNFDERWNLAIDETGPPDDHRPKDFTDFRLFCSAAYRIKELTDGREQIVSEHGRLKQENEEQSERIKNLTEELEKSRDNERQLRELNETLKLQLAQFVSPTCDQVVQTDFSFNSYSNQRPFSPSNVDLLPPLLTPVTNPIQEVIPNSLASPVSELGSRDAISNVVEAFHSDPLGEGIDDIPTLECYQDLRRYIPSYEDYENKVDDVNDDSILLDECKPEDVFPCSHIYKHRFLKTSHNFLKNELNKLINKTCDNEVPTNDNSQEDATSNKTEENEGNASNGNQTNESENRLEVPPATEVSTEVTVTVPNTGSVPNGNSVIPQPAFPSQPVVRFPPKPENCLTTPRLYFTSSADGDGTDDMILHDAEDRDTEIGDFVEVPQWRICSYSPLPVVPDVDREEDVSEAAVLKRHARLETDEKRRKRWDSQRVREESYVERLKRRIEEREKQKIKKKRAGGRKAVNGVSVTSGEVEDEDVEPIHPQAHDIKYIRVSERLPVSVYGHAVPILRRRSFKPPWVSKNERVLFPTRQVTTKSLSNGETSQKNSRKSVSQFSTESSTVDFESNNSGSIRKNCENQVLKFVDSTNSVKRMCFTRDSEISLNTCDEIVSLNNSFAPKTFPPNLNGMLKGDESLKSSEINNAFNNLSR